MSLGEKIFKKVGGLLSEKIAEDSAYDEATPKGQEEKFKKQRNIQIVASIKKRADEIRTAKPSGPFTEQEKRIIEQALGEDSGG